MAEMLRRFARVAALLCGVAILGARPTGQAASLFGVLGVPEEIAPLERRLINPETQPFGSSVVTIGLLEGHRVFVGRSGIGKVNAAAATALLLERFHPAALIFSGTAGALDPALGPGDVIIATKVAQHDTGRVTTDGFNRRPTRDSVTGEPNPLFFETPAALLAAARAAVNDVKLPAARIGNGTRQPRVHEGVVVTGDVFVADPVRKKELREFGGSVVEMEGAAMVQVCRQFSTPCLVVRSVTDAADGSAVLSYQTYLKPASENAAAVTAATIARFAATTRR
jgi:adenosylhomocysteine nucleosidase